VNGPRRAPSLTRRRARSAHALGLVVALVTVLSGCAARSHWLRVDPPWTAAVFARSESARLTLADERVVELVLPVYVAAPDGPLVRGRDDAGERSVALHDVTSVAVRTEGTSSAFELAGPVSTSQIASVVGLALIALLLVAAF
jgi:hypothetical protein